MDTSDLFAPNRKSKAWIVLIISLIILVSTEFLASLVQKDFGRVEVSNVSIQNIHHQTIRAKLLKPVGISSIDPAPGVVYIHGYQNNRETSDAYAIEMARRGFVVLEIDALGRGNSSNPFDLTDARFDPTFGGRTSFEYLKSLPFVNVDSVGLMGHSLGAEMVYSIAIDDPTVKALVISGFAYREDASMNRPRNLIMIFGKFDEYRKRMTGTDDVENDWLTSSQTLAAIGFNSDLEFNTLYGDFDDGSARKVILLPVIHLGESHSRKGITAAVEWMQSALHPSPEFWIDAENQIWQMKEFATLVAMVAGLFSLMPLGLILLRLDFFSSLQGIVADTYTCSRKELMKYASINGGLAWLYLPLIFILFGLHVYVIPIDKIFPMMMVNGTVWWFLWINIFGFLILKAWFRRQNSETGLLWSDLGISFDKDNFKLDMVAIGKSFGLAFALFAFGYLLEAILESIFIVDYRFIFPFASDFTLYRFGLWFLYFPILLISFILLGFFLHGQLRTPKKGTWLKTYASWSITNTIVMILPLILFLLVQYVPIYSLGIIPFVGPGGMLVSFTMNLFHIIGVLIMVIPIQTWFFQLTGRPYLGAVLNAAIVTWMFTSSQVIAPIPI